MIELATVNILNELTIYDLLRQLDGLLHHPDVWPNIYAATWLLCDVRHLALCRSLENCLSERIG